MSKHFILISRPLRNTLLTIFCLIVFGPLLFERMGAPWYAIAVLMAVYSPFVGIVVRQYGVPRNLSWILGTPLSKKRIIFLNYLISAFAIISSALCGCVSLIVLLYIKANELPKLFPGLSG